MTHDELRELTGGYALGVLSEAERRELEAHLPTCPACEREVREFAAVTGGLAYAVPQHDPPAALRDRVLRAVVESSGAREVAPPRLRASFALPTWLAAAASIAAVALGLYAVNLRQQIDTLEKQLREAIANAEGVKRELQVAQASERHNRDIRDIIDVVDASDVRVIALAGQKPAPAASGRAYWSASRKRLYFIAANLPQPETGRQYQLWVIPPGKNPVSAGMLDVGSDGRVLVLADSATADLQTVAVSIEPTGGVPSPTGALFLVGSL
jgi:anti-sigma-K factor RskA